MEHVLIRVTTVGPDLLPLCHAIRREVFVLGQAVPEALEIDGEDLECTQFLAYDGDRPVGTARMKHLADAAKAQRVAVLSSERGRGIGAALMAALEAEAARVGLPEVVLGAQTHAIPFYERIGYQAYGPVYLDAGIEHRDMRKAV